ncbi:MAG TPA: nicotinate (nicotinamide) nucleotide adenylyltransferase [Bacteroidales bacterium]|jgi:nicotinate-nucleotide adenylyltransferase|nr:nicotinate (nicotinamide) nucleotide adenylyltransferase [Bacteroidales bacterium]
MEKVGLYFGSFNPVHIGHIAIAGYMTEFTELSQVWFVVSPHNPLKNKETLLPDHQRLHMTRLAVGDNDKLKASDIEFKLPIPSYTIDTLAYLKERHKSKEFCLLMGEDNLYTLHKWKNIDALITNYRIYVYPRPFSIRPENTALDSILSKAMVYKVNAPLMEISSTFIREGIKAGKNMSYYVPGPTWKYIKEMHFYEK